MGTARGCFGTCSPSRRPRLAKPLASLRPSGCRLAGRAHWGSPAPRPWSARGPSTTISSGPGPVLRARERSRRPGQGSGARYPGVGAVGLGGPGTPFPRPGGRPAEAGRCPALRHPCGPAATPPVFLSPTLFVLPSAPEPLGWGGGPGPPLRPRPEREVPGPPALPARRAQLGWVGFCSRRKITPGA